MAPRRATAKQITNISQLKGQLHNIIANINELERLAANFGTGDVNALQQRTNELLKQVERAPLELITKHIQKRKRRRQSRKIIKRQLKQKQRSQTYRQAEAPAAAAVAAESSAAAADPAGAVTTATEPPADAAEATSSVVVQPTTEAATAICAAVPMSTDTSSRSSTIKPHQQLRNYYDAQRFLRTFELLKILHLTRGQDVAATREFAAQLNNLRAIWNSVLQENAPQRTQAHRIEDQWDEVLFGPKERVYYGSSGEHKMGDLLRVRRIWDSYLTHSKHGTAIPTGWVLPTKNATAAWQQHRAN